MNEKYCYFRWIQIYWILLSLHKRGHKITLYNRNITIPSIKYPDDIILIVGDRNNSSDYKKLFIKYYDVVYDLSGYNLTQVNPILMFYKKYIGHYIFCSTTSVYKYTNNPPYNEECAKVFNPNTYGGDKSLVEEVLLGHCLKYNWPVDVMMGLRIMLRELRIVSKHRGSR